ncbi:MAG: hypothetical protein WCJ17_01470 [bacterium]|jgi:hypothetical protein
MMELVMIAGFLAVAAFFGNIRLVAFCALLALGAGWYYEQMPREQQRHVMTVYNDVKVRLERSWHAFWL